MGQLIGAAVVAAGLGPVDDAALMAIALYREALGFPPAGAAGLVQGAVIDLMGSLRRDREFAGVARGRLAI